MKRFFSVVGAFIIATGLSCTAFTGLGFADSVDDSLEEDGETDYDTVRQAAIDTIEAYLANLAGGLDDDELKNKNLNTEQKAEVIKAYNLLNSEDQAPYTELIARIERGGIPQLEYVGEAEYDRAEDIDYLQVIRATDNEDNNADGVMNLNADNTSCELTQEYTIDNATYQPYTLRCSVTDSDGNTGSLTQEVRIKTTIVDDEEDPGHTPDDPAGDPGDDNPDDQNPGPGDNPDDPGTNPPDDGKDDPDNPDDDNKPGDDQNPDDEEPDDNKPGDGDGDNDGNTGGNNGGNNGADDEDNSSDDQTGGNNNSNTPTLPGSSDSNNNSSNNSGSSSKFPNTLPNTGPSSFFNQIPTSVYYSVLIGLVVATTVFCLTKKTTETELTKDIR